MSVHPQAIVDPSAQIADDAEIGPYVFIEKDVVIGSGTRIYPYAYIGAYTTIGRNCEIHPSAVVGHLPQDFHFGGERSYCRIGDGTTIREHVSVHRGTQPESVTDVGPNCFLMAYSHVGHNSVLAEGVKVYNNTALAGHVDVDDHAIISAHTVVHQFVRIGRYTMIGASSRAVQDIPPFLSYAPEVGLLGVNRIGLRRAEFSADTIRELSELYKIIFRSGKPKPAALADAEPIATTPEGRHFIEFCAVQSKRGMEGGPDRSRSRREWGKSRSPIEDESE